MSLRHTAIHKVTKGLGVVGYGRNMDGKEPFTASNQKAEGRRSNDAKQENKLYSIYSSLEQIA